MCLIFLLFRTVFDQSVDDASRKLTLKTENIEKLKIVIIEYNRSICFSNVLQLHCTTLLVFSNKIFINKRNIVLVNVYCLIFD